LVTVPGRDDGDAQQGARAAPSRFTEHRSKATEQQPEGGWSRIGEGGRLKALSFQPEDVERQWVVEVAGLEAENSGVKRGGLEEIRWFWRGKNKYIF
jgi:uncharacterized protein involved in type VI secretion and phage assembly